MPPSIVPLNTYFLYCIVNNLKAGTMQSISPVPCLVHSRVSIKSKRYHLPLLYLIPSVPAHPAVPTSSLLGQLSLHLFFIPSPHMTPTVH